MSKVKFWNIAVDEMHYAIEYDPTTLAGRKRVMVNGVPIPLKFPLFYDVTGFDKILYLGNKAIHFVIIKGVADLVVDGFYLSTQKPYTPLPKIPAWSWVFIVASLLIPIVTLGGAVPVLIGFLSAAGNAKIAINQRWNTPIKVALCFVVTGVAWVLLLVFIELVSVLLY